MHEFSQLYLSHCICTDGGSESWTVSEQSILTAVPMTLPWTASRLLDGLRNHCNFNTVHHLHTAASLDTGLNICTANAQFGTLTQEDTEDAKIKTVSRKRDSLGKFTLQLAGVRLVQSITVTVDGTKLERASALLLAA